MAELSPPDSPVAAAECVGGLAELLATEPAATVERYIRGFAERCRVDPGQRRYWSARMFATQVGAGRRLSAWAAIRSTVDRHRGATQQSSESRPGPARRYGGGRVRL